MQPRKQQPTVMSFSVQLDLPSRQVGELLAEQLVGVPRGYVTGFDPEWTVVTLTSETRQGVSQAEAKVKAMMEQINHEITTRTEYLHPSCVPLLCGDWGGRAVASIEELYHVQISFTVKNMPLQELSSIVLSKYVPPLLLIEHLQELTIPVLPLGEEVVAPSPSASVAAWCYSTPDRNFSPFTSAECRVLEKLFYYGGHQVLLSGQLCTVDFKEMTVIGESGETATLRRTPPSALLEQRLTLNLKGPELYATNALSNLKERLNREFKSSCIVLNPTGRAFALSHSEQQITNICRQYCVEFNFESTADQHMLHIKGSKEYVDQVYPLIQEFVLRVDIITSQPPAILPQAAVRTPTLSSGPPTACQGGVPPTWRRQSTRCEIYPVTPGSQEWNETVSKMRTTIVTINVLQLDRVQNCTLWERYHLEGGQMSERNSGETNEKYLFHGTNTTDPYTIARSESGIDFRCSTRNRKLLWGNGAYFAEKASYSDHYSHELANGTRQMMIVSVLTGIAYPCGATRKPDWTRPPERIPGCLYDTVRGFSGESHIYVVYDHAKSCPAYIITYTK